MNIRSSWNTDRIAAASMAGKSHAPRRIYKRPTATLRSKLLRRIPAPQNVFTQGCNIRTSRPCK